MAYQPNDGHIPDACLILDDDGNVTGHRSVHVRLFGGFDTAKAGHAPWPAKGGRPCDTDWSISKRPHPFQIREWEIA